MSHSKSNRTQPNPSGFCMCGCGQRTTLVEFTSAPRGRFKGDFNRYVANHSHALKSFEKYRVNPKTGCWDWLRKKNPQGYGMMWRGHRCYGAHVLFWIDANGPIPEGCDLHHRCKNKGCVNPAHLEPLSRIDHEARDGRLDFLRDYGKSRAHIERMRQSKQVKLTPEKREQAWTLKGTMSNKRIGTMLGVSSSTIDRLFDGTCWADVA